MHALHLALLTCKEMGQADAAAISAGVSGSDLMQAAGAAVARTIQAHWTPRNLLVLCGPGNNGGDGFVAARLLADLGWPVRLMLLGRLDTLKGDAAHHADLWTREVESLSEPAVRAAVADWAELALDALFGAGLARPLEGPPAAAVEALNAARVPTVAVDVPSGLSGDTGAPLGDLCLRATRTVTFCRKKPGHLLMPGRILCGELELADIGIPDRVVQDLQPRTWENGPALWRHALKWRTPESHKYDFGHLLVAGGAVVTGAAKLAARAALRCGAGLVSVATPDAARAVYQNRLDSLIVLPADTPEAFAGLLTDPRKSAVLLGPGLGTDGPARGWVAAALASGRPLVLDADALTCFANAPQDLAAQVRGPVVATPHAGEFARLFGKRDGDKLDLARMAARELQTVLVYKGYDTVVAAPDGRALINRSAPPELATAGAGDVLSGMIGSYLAQGLPAFEAAAAAVWIHGRAAQDFGPGLIADDLPERIPPVLSILQPDVGGGA